MDSTLVYARSSFRTPRFLKPRLNVRIVTPRPPTGLVSTLLRSGCIFGANVIVGYCILLVALALDTDKCLDLKVHWSPTPINSIRQQLQHVCTSNLGELSPIPS